MDSHPRVWATPKRRGGPTASKRLGKRGGRRANRLRWRRLTSPGSTNRLSIRGGPARDVMYNISFWEDCEGWSCRTLFHPHTVPHLLYTLNQVLWFCVLFSARTFLAH